LFNWSSNVCAGLLWKDRFTDTAKVVAGQLLGA
jgi:hypothetical protein